MTIKLLTPRGSIPVNAIITLDAATEAALVAEGVATTNTAGGTVWNGPPRNSSEPAAQAYAGAGAVSGGGKTAALTLVSIGDSNNNNANSNNGQTGAANFTRQFKTSDIGWLTWFLIFIAGALKLIRNSGRAGDTSGDMRARFMTDVVALSPSVALIVCSINDRQLGGQADLGYQYSIDNYQWMAETALANGIQVIFATALPNNYINSLGAGHIKVENMLRVNDWMRRYAETKPGVMLLDAFTPIQDQTTLCDAVAGSFNTPTDKTHTLVISAWKTGLALAKSVAGIFKPRPVIASLGGVASATNPYGNLVKYPTVSGTGGTMPGVYTSTLAGVSITGTGGQFSCNSTSLVVGQAVTISGTFAGGGSITGYSNPTTYYIIATNGSTTFTLSATQGGAAITTTAGTPTGLTYTVSGSVPDGWWLQNDGNAVSNAAHTAVMTRPARTDYPDMTWWQSTVTWSALQNTVTVFTHRLLSAATLTIPAGVNVGDLIDCAIELEYSSVKNAGAYTAGALTVEFVARQGTTDLTFTDGQWDNGQTYVAGLTSGQSPTTPTPDFAGVVAANGMPLPAGCDNIMVRIQCRNLAGTVGGYTLRIGRTFVGKRL
ncbi:GDSL-type esterase/lipase family protein [Roseateles sp. BYS96W]|uniref:GDSL-type esterase/lipase family protein n=1 Tax=Pelomonas nitida TaxID=3299027 RepID=A0ABW7G7J0_9BURK